MTKVEDLTGFPECLDGRVKTLHPKVHAGILADRRLETHVEQLEELGVEPFDLVVSNLYPFRETVASGATPDECVEQIDIGGPSMVRAAAKNHPSVAIVRPRRRTPTCSPPWPPEGSPSTSARRLAAEAFAHTATYDVAVASWMGSVLTDTPEGDRASRSWVGATFTKVADLRYGENPHQTAALYAQRVGPRDWPAPSSCTARRCPTTTTSTPTPRAGRVRASPSRRVAIIKHANPCGLAVGADVAEAHRRAHECDPVSAFGGVIATQPAGVGRDGRAGRRGVHRGDRGAGYEDGAVEVLQAKKNLRILVADADERLRVRVPSGLRRLLKQQVDHVDAPGRRPGPRGRWPRARPPTRPPSPTWPSRGRPAARSSPTRSCWPPTGPRSASAWARSTGSTRAGSRSSAPATLAKGSDGRGVRRVLPLRGRPADPDRRRRARRSSSRVARCGTSSRSRRARRPGDAVLHRHQALRPLISPRRAAVATSRLGGERVERATRRMLVKMPGSASRTRNTQDRVTG